MLKPLQWIYSIYAMITFVLIMFMIVPVAIIASFFGPVRGGNIVYRLCTFWSDLWAICIVVRTKRIYEVPYSQKQVNIIVCNHNSYFNSFTLLRVFRRPIRPLARKETTKIPVFGFLYDKVVVTVDRSSPENRIKSVSRMKALLRRGVSVLIFPEGTFNLTKNPLKDFYDGAFRIAIETQTPLQPVLFIDDYKRMPPHHLFAFTPGICRAVFLEEIPVDGLTMDDVPALRQKTHDIMSRKLLEYKASWIQSGVRSQEPGVGR